MLIGVGKHEIYMYHCW